MGLRGSGGRGLSAVGQRWKGAALPPHTKGRERVRPLHGPLRPLLHLSHAAEGDGGDARPR